MPTEILYIWSDSPALSVAVWLLIAITVMYLGRPHAHQLLRSTGRAIAGSLRLAAAGIRQLEQRVTARNRDVLLAMGHEEAERAIEREFDRVNAIVERDLSQYPELHRKLSDVLLKVEADYHESTAEAPLPPACSEVISAVSSLPDRGDPAVLQVLESIKDAVEHSHRETLEAYRENTAERHRILHAMQPQWRALNNTLERVEKTVTGLGQQARTIDRQMENYESMRRADDKAVHALTASSLTQFLIASLVLVIAGFGGLINFHLIALPMSEMVGGGNQIGAVRISDIAALVIILVEISMGIFLLESLRITRLFPIIGRMDDRMRKRMAIAAFTILFIFAGIEASLAYMRDLIAIDRAALTQTLAGAEMAEAQFRWVPSVAQLVLGFVLPFALAFVAIPLESFMHSLRTVLGLLALGALRMLRLAMRVTGAAANHVSKMLVSLYDLLIMLPLGIERLVKRLHTRTPEQPEVYGDAGVEDADGGRSKEKGKRRSRRGRANPGAATDTSLTPQEV